MSTLCILAVPIILPLEWNFCLYDGMHQLGMLTFAGLPLIAFGFLSPADVTRAAHIIPCFSKGM